MDFALFVGSAAVFRFVKTGGSWLSSTASCCSPSSVAESPKAKTDGLVGPNSTDLDLALLEKQNADTSNKLIELYAGNEAFAKLSKYEGDLTVERDTLDGEKLQKGIDFAKEKGVIDPKFVPEPYFKIDVLGKTPGSVADMIIEKVTTSTGKSGGGGAVIVLVGLSGTGKGTTVAMLHEKLQSKGQHVVTWSNGNLFRSVTLLAATWCEQQKPPVTDIEKACTKENLASFMSMLSFSKDASGKFDTTIKGLGLEYKVSEVQNTVLKSPIVSKNIPTVAQYTQGEVILFAGTAMEIMSSQPNMVVLLEGREQTVNYVPTKHRFELVLSDPTLIGKRRAAQRLMGDALSSLKKTTGGGDNSKDTIKAALDAALQTMVKDI